MFLLCFGLVGLYRSLGFSFEFMFLERFDKLNMLEVGIKDSNEFGNFFKWGIFGKMRIFRENMKESCYVVGEVDGFFEF